MSAASGDLTLLEKWARIKKSGSFKRKLLVNHKRRNTNIFRCFVTSQSATIREVQENNENNIILDVNNIVIEDQHEVVLPEPNSTQGYDWMEVECSDDEEDINEALYQDEKNCDFIDKMRIWSIKNNIRQNTLKELLQICNERIPNVFPQDPRTFLNTPQSIQVLPVGSGHYWHQGLRYCLEKVLYNIQENKEIEININIDGLPTLRSSKEEFWPILFNIHEMPTAGVLVVGIFCGHTKPSNLKEFLNQFVEEANLILKDGITINGHQIAMKIRSVICDSPARAFVKGVCNFNGQHGCLKCCTVGEYSYVSHCNYFPINNCKKRTDEEFRKKAYESHHKYDSPLLNLPLDMINDFPVGDSLHLLHLGIMKRCLLGWRDGKLGSYRTKWSAKDSSEITVLLLQCRMPREIHRAVRGLDSLSHWKGLEFRTFLHYIGVVLLKNYLPSDVYNHFLLLFCAVTICSSKKYEAHLHLADNLLQNFVKLYAVIYGKDYITSNVHNLWHLVDDVRRFGILSSFSAYPFESKLYQIKNLIRNGNKPLIQVAKRMHEINQLTFNHTYSKQSQFPIFKKKLKNLPETISFQRNDEQDIYAKVQLENFCLSNERQDQWFLTNNHEVVATEYIVRSGDSTFILGRSLKRIESLFERPICSTFLNIYTSDCTKNPPTLYALNEINCKLVFMPDCKTGKNIFIPLLHTL